MYTTLRVNNTMDTISIMSNKSLLSIMLIWIHLLAVAQENTLRTKGYLTFKADNVIYKADSTHSRGYALPHARRAFLSAANKANMLFDAKWNNLKSTGDYVLYKGKGEVEVTIQHKRYKLMHPDDYLKITITEIKEKGTLQMLQGFFEGRLHNDDGNMLRISEGKFNTSIL